MNYRARNLSKSTNFVAELLILRVRVCYNVSVKICAEETMNEILFENRYVRDENTAKEIIDGLAAATGAEPIQAIGGKIVLYKRSTRDNFKHIEF